MDRRGFKIIYLLKHCFVFVFFFKYIEFISKKQILNMFINNILYYMYLLCNMLLVTYCFIGFYLIYIIYFIPSSSVARLDDGIK